MSDPKTTFFCGIGGSGMSALAQILVSRGQTVHGSDRSHDRGENAALYDTLSVQGIRLCPQDGSGIGSDVSELIVSTAVESSIPDVAAARDAGIPIRHRSDLLASIFNGTNGIAVGGSSGKSTVTGMIATILAGVGRSPTVINGGAMLNAATGSALGNAICGDADDVVIEADESDGSIANYEAGVAVVTNISLDHKSLDELNDLFADFCLRARSTVINLDSGTAARLRKINPECVTYSIEGRGADLTVDAVELEPGGSRFRAHFRGESVDASLNVPGFHNVSNALAAVGATVQSGVLFAEAVRQLSEFAGIKRRLQVLGQANGITLFDDFAHNPEKIAASLSTLRMVPGRLFILFQPHGFAPTRLTKDGLIAAFVDGLDEGDQDRKSVV